MTLFHSAVHIIATCQVAYYTCTLFFSHLNGLCKYGYWFFGDFNFSDEIEWQRTPVMVSVLAYILLKCSLCTFLVIVLICYKIMLVHMYMYVDMLVETYEFQNQSAVLSSDRFSSWYIRV